MPEATTIGPAEVLYNHIDRLLVLRTEGKGATEAMEGLYGLLAPFRAGDETFDKKCKELWARVGAAQKAGVKEEQLKQSAFWEWFDEAIALLARRGLWLRAQVYEGESE